MAEIAVTPDLRWLPTDALLAEIVLTHKHFFPVDASEKEARLRSKIASLRAVIDDLGLGFDRDSGAASTGRSTSPMNAQQYDWEGSGDDGGSVGSAGDDDVSSIGPFDRFEANPRNRARAAYVVGAAINASEEYEEEAETLLSMAVKLTPRNVAAWDALGETFWKKGEMTTARLCFEGGLDSFARGAAGGAAVPAAERAASWTTPRRAEESDAAFAARKRALLNLSMLLRAHQFDADTSGGAAPVPAPPGPPLLGADHVEESVREAAAANARQQSRMAQIHGAFALARSAVKLDASDPLCWFGLGNAYMNLFFQASNNPVHLEKSLGAYRNAELRDTSKAGRNADLYHNRSKVLRYLEQCVCADCSLPFSLSLTSNVHTTPSSSSPNQPPHRYDAAATSLEIASSINPFFRKSDRTVDDIERYLTRVADLVARKARLKPSRLARLLETLPRNGVAPAKGRGKKGKGKGKKGKRGKGSIVASAEKAVVFGREVVPISALIAMPSEGGAPGKAKGGSPNVGKAVQLKVLLCAKGPNPPPACFIVADGEGTVTAMSLYSIIGPNLHALTDRVVLTILDPVLRMITYTPRGAAGSGTKEPIAYQCICVMQPHLLLVNGRQLQAICSSMSQTNSG